MKILVDMNLSPQWVRFLSANGVEAIHWMDVGARDADDSTVLAWARDHGQILFTHDLDFSALIALAGLNGPSVLQVRTQDVLPEDIGSKVLGVLRDHKDALTNGAIVTVVEQLSRVRVLPILRRPK